MFCTKCGSKLGNTSVNFCGNCGARRSDVVATEPVAQQKFVPAQVVPSPRKKNVALWLAALLGPWAYVYLLKTHKSKAIGTFVVGFVASLPALIALYSDPAYLKLITLAFTPISRYSESPEPVSGQPFNPWVIYLTPLGLVSIALHLVLHVFIFIDLWSLPKKFYEEYKE